MFEFSTQLSQDINMKRMILTFILGLYSLAVFGQTLSKGLQLLEKATKDFQDFCVDVTNLDYLEIISTAEQAVSELKNDSDSINLCKALNLLSDLYSEQLDKSPEMVKNFNLVRDYSPDSNSEYVIMAKSILASFVVNYRPDYALKLLSTVDSFDMLHSFSDIIKVGYVKAAVYNFTGDYVSASMLWGTINDIEEEYLDDYSLVWYLIAKGDYALYVLSCLGNEREAFTILYECANLIVERKLTNSIAYIKILRDIGIAYYRIRKFEDALSFLENIEEYNVYNILFGEKSFSNVINMQILAEIYSGLGQYEKSDSLIVRGLESVDKYFDINSLAGIVFYSTYANNLSLQKKYEQSSDAYKECIKISEHINYHEHQCYANLAINLNLAGLHNEALDITITGIEKERVHLHNTFLSLSEKGRESYWTSRGYHNTRLYTIVASDPYDNNGTLYNIALLSKGVLMESSSLFLQLIEQNADEKFKEEWENYLLLLDSINNQKLTSDDEILQYEQLRVSILKQESFLMGKASELKDYLENLKCTWKDVANKLDANSVAIEFIRYNDWETRTVRYFASVLQNEGPPVNIPLIDFDEVEVQKWSFKKKYQSNSLYNVLVKPLAEYIKHKSKIYFAPVGCLNNISVENIPIPKNGCLSDKYEIHRLSSTRMITSLNEHINIASASLFGGLNYNSSNEEVEYYSSKNGTRHEDGLHDWRYLPGSLEEVKIIGNQLSHINPIIISGSEGIEERFKRLSGERNNLIHIATHGYYDIESIKQVVQNNIPIEDEALRLSGLVFSGANNTSENDINNDDGLLSAGEISKLNLVGCDLVVLSACGTGLGVTTSFNESYGLIRAFKKAGCKSILMSLWDVDDKASQLFMDYFYQALLSGNTKSEAVSVARNIVRKKYSNPEYWAGFILID